MDGTTIALIDKTIRHWQARLIMLEQPPIPPRLLPELEAIHVSCNALRVLRDTYAQQQEGGDA